MTKGNRRENIDEPFRNGIVSPAVSPPLFGSVLQTDHRKNPTRTEKPKNLRPKPRHNNGLGA